MQKMTIFVADTGEIPFAVGAQSNLEVDHELDLYFLPV